MPLIPRYELQFQADEERGEALLAVLNQQEDFSEPIETCDHNDIELPTRDRPIRVGFVDNPIKHSREEPLNIEIKQTNCDADRPDDPKSNIERGKSNGVKL